MACRRGFRPDLSKIEGPGVLNQNAPDGLCPARRRSPGRTTDFHRTWSFAPSCWWRSSLSGPHGVQHPGAHCRSHWSHRSPPLDPTRVESARSLRRSLCTGPSHHRAFASRPRHCAGGPKRWARAHSPPKSKTWAREHGSRDRGQRRIPREGPLVRDLTRFRNRRALGDAPLDADKILPKSRSDIKTKREHLSARRHAGPTRR